MSADNKKKGKEGEDIANDFLLKKGYKIIGRNYRFGKGEIDIIAQTGELLVFVEVKSRKNDEFGRPEYAITQSKQKQIIRIAKAYLYENEIRNVQCRFDVVAISFEKKNNPNINHIENAFIEM